MHTLAVTQSSSTCAGHSYRIVSPGGCTEVIAQWYTRQLLRGTAQARHHGFDL